MEDRILAQHLEIGVLEGQEAVVGVELDGALETRDGGGQLPAQGVDDGQHVMDVVVVGYLDDQLLELGQAAVVVAGVGRKGGRVDALLDAFRRAVGRHGLPFADVEVDANPVVQLFLFGVAIEDRTQQLGRTGVLTLLEGL